MNEVVAGGCVLTSWFPCYKVTIIHWHPLKILSFLNFFWFEGLIDITTFNVCRCYLGKLFQGWICLVIILTISQISTIKACLFGSPIFSNIFIPGTPVISILGCQFNFLYFKYIYIYKKKIKSKDKLDLEDNNLPRG